jgi:hypothetical protein
VAEVAKLEAAVVVLELSASAGGIIPVLDFFTASEGASAVAVAGAAFDEADEDDDSSAMSAVPALALAMGASATGTGIATVASDIGTSDGVASEVGGAAIAAESSMAVASVAALVVALSPAVIVFSSVFLA